MPEFLTATGAAALTLVLGWLLYLRKHRAAAVGAEKNNDRTEIENYKLIAQEWREAAQQWKDLADEYQTKLTLQSRVIVELEAREAGNRKEINALKGKLTKALNRITHLENGNK